MSREKAVKEFPQKPGRRLRIGMLNAVLSRMARCLPVPRVRSLDGSKHNGSREPEDAAATDSVPGRVPSPRVLGGRMMTEGRTDQQPILSVKVNIT